MATNYTLSQARKAVIDGDKPIIMDLGRRFPLTTLLLGKIGENKAVDELLNAIPEYVTARKVEAILKGDSEETTNEESEENVEEVVEEKAEEQKEEVKEKKPRATRKKKETVKEEVKEDEFEEAMNEPEEETVDYESMNAVELFKLCKKRGIKVEPKKKASEYIKLLKAADEPEKTEDDDDDDWDI